MNLNTKPKRKAEFTHKETGQQLFLDRIKSNTVYFMCDSPNLSIQDNYFDVKVDLLIPARKVGSGLVSKPKQLNTSEKDKKTAINQFFTQMALRMPTHCENCGELLYAFNSFAKRSCTAHILAKSDFPSIATNPDNILFMGAEFLGGCSCHTKYDSMGAEFRATMDIYPTALIRFEQMKHLLTPREVNKALTYLNIKFR